MTEKDGGPAFPVENGPDTGYSPGMYLRDYFAAKAMQGILSSQYWTPAMIQQVAEKGDLSKVGIELAHGAYEFADAMIKIREERR